MKSMVSMYYAPSHQSKNRGFQLENMILIQLNDREYTYAILTEASTVIKVTINTSHSNTVMDSIRRYIYPRIIKLIYHRKP